MKRSGSNHERIPLETAELPWEKIEKSASLLREASSSSSHLSAATAAAARSLWSRLFFQWFTPVLEQGHAAQKLQPDDLERVPFPADCQTAHVYDAFARHWHYELEQHASNPSLVRALVRAFGRDYAVAGCLKLLHDLCLFVGPTVLHGMIVFLRDETAPLSTGLWWTLAVTASQTSMSLLVRHYFFRCYATGLRLRTAVTVAVYRKALRLAAVERQTKTLGEITNLMSVDAQRLQGTCMCVRQTCLSFLFWI